MQRQPRQLLPRQLPPRQLHADDGFAERVSLVSERESGGGGDGGRGGGGDRDKDRSSAEEAEAATHMIVTLREEAMRLRQHGQSAAWRRHGCHLPGAASGLCGASVTQTPGPARAASLCGGLPTSRLRRRGQPGAAMVKLKLAKQLQAQRDAAARKHTRVRRPDILYSACI